MLGSVASDVYIAELSAYSNLDVDGCTEQGWVELANLGTGPLDLSGSVLCGEPSCQNASSKYVFPAATILPASARGVLCRDGKFTFSTGGLEPAVVTLENSGGDVLATVGLPGCTVTTSIMSCTDRIFSEFEREQKVSYGMYTSGQETLYGFLHPQSPGEDNVLSCAGSPASCTYVPEHVWNVTCANAYSEEFLGNEASCLQACSEQSQCNFFWVNEQGKCSRFETCNATRQVIWSFDGLESRTTTWRKVAEAQPLTDNKTCAAPFTCPGTDGDGSSTSAASTSSAGNDASVSRPGRLAGLMTSATWAILLCWWL